MKTREILIAALCFLPYALCGQVDIFGYFEPQYAALYQDTTIIQSGYGKLRIDLRNDQVKNMRFNADIILSTYLGKTDWNLLDFLPDQIADSIPPAMQPYYLFQFKDTFYLDNAYARFNIRSFAVTIGKQQISFGTGYFSNPTDVFNVKNSLDPTYEQPGYDALRFEFYPLSRLSITMLYTPIEFNWDNSGKLCRIKIGLGHFDISSLIYRYRGTTIDYYTFEPTIRQFTMIGGDLVGELLGFGVWGEGSYRIIEDGNNIFEVLVGSDYTFEGGLYTMIEYHHNSTGKNDYRDYDLNDWMRFLTGESKTIARDQLYGLVQYPIIDFVDLGAMALFSISDQSAAIIPMLNYNMFENVDITLMLNLYTGEEGKAFNSKFGNGGFIRANIYF